jgi:hypothetical protein
VRWLVLLLACSHASEPVVANHPPRRDRLIGASDLVALGFTVERDGVLCRGRTCVCTQPMGQGTLERTLETADRTSAAPACENQTGKLCGVTYVDFHRWILFFTGNDLVGILRDLSPDGSCDVRATWTMFGVIPDCDEPARDVRSLCTPARPLRDLGNPKDLLLLP